MANSDSCPRLEHIIMPPRKKRGRSLTSLPGPDSEAVSPPKRTRRGSAYGASGESSPSRRSSRRHRQEDEQEAAPMDTEDVVEEDAAGTSEPVEVEVVQEVQEAEAGRGAATSASGPRMPAAEGLREEDELSRLRMVCATAATTFNKALEGDAERLALKSPLRAQGDGGRVAPKEPQEKLTIEQREQQQWTREAHSRRHHVPAPSGGGGVAPPAPPAHGSPLRSNLSSPTRRRSAGKTPAPGKIELRRATRRPPVTDYDEVPRGLPLFASLVALFVGFLLLRFPAPRPQPGTSSRGVSYTYTPRLSDAAKAQIQEQVMAEVMGGLTPTPPVQDDSQLHAQIITVVNEVASIKEKWDMREARQKKRVTELISADQSSKLQAQSFFDEVSGVRRGFEDLFVKVQGLSENEMADSEKLELRQNSTKEGLEKMTDHLAKIEARVLVARSMIDEASQLITAQTEAQKQTQAVALPVTSSLEPIERADLVALEAASKLAEEEARTFQELRQSLQELKIQLQSLEEEQQQQNKPKEPMGPDDEVVQPIIKETIQKVMEQVRDETKAKIAEEESLSSMRLAQEEEELVSRLADEATAKVLRYLTLRHHGAVVDKVDYAAKVYGGRVVDISKAHPDGQGAKDPDIVLSHTRGPGDCYPMDMAQDHAFVKVELSKPVVPSAFTIMHATANARGSPEGTAPKHFQVYGYKAGENDTTAPIALGSYMFSRPDAETFPIHPKPGALPPVSAVELRVLDNHGHKPYTCLYRFQVHGAEWMKDAGSVGGVLEPEPAHKEPAHEDLHTLAAAAVEGDGEMVDAVGPQEQVPDGPSVRARGPKGRKEETRPKEDSKARSRKRHSRTVRGSVRDRKKTREEVDEL